MVVEGDGNATAGWVKRSVSNTMLEKIAETCSTPEVVFTGLVGALCRGYIGFAGVTFSLFAVVLYRPSSGTS